MLTCSLKNYAANVTCTHMTTRTKIYEHLHAYIQIHCPSNLGGPADKVTGTALVDCDGEVGI